LRQARAVLKTLKTWKLVDKDKQLFQFFKGYLIYEEMLRSVVSQDEVDLKNVLSRPEPAPTALIKGNTAPVGVAFPPTSSGFLVRRLRSAGDPGLVGGTMLAQASKCYREP